MEWRAHKFKTCCLCSALLEEENVQENIARAQGAGEVFIQGHDLGECLETSEEKN